MTLWSRRGNLFTTQFPRIARACERLPGDTLLDGEIVAIDKSGQISFNLLQHHRSHAHALLFYAFDVIVCRGKGLMSTPLEKRTLLNEIFEDLGKNASPIFSTSLRQEFKPTGEIFYFRAHGRNAKAWWKHAESWERYDYLYTRAEIKKIAGKVKEAAGTAGVKKAFAVFNNHARANSAANAIMLSQELGVRLKAMPSEAMVAKFPDLVQGRETVYFAGA